MERNEEVKKIVILDGDSIIHQVGWAVKDTRNEELGKTTLNDYIYKIMRDTKATHYIAFAQSKSFNFRYNVYKDYKSKRPEALEHIKFWKPIMVDIMHNQWGFFDPSPLEVESDDCMQATFSRLSQIYDPETEIVMAYIDKDISNVYTDEAPAHVYYNYSSKNRGWFRVRRERSIFFFWKMMIMGDASDGLPGIFGKGKAYADKLLTPNQENPRAMFFTVYREYLKAYGTEGRETYKQMHKCIKLENDIKGFELPELRKVPDLSEKIKADILNI